MRIWNVDFKTGTFWESFQKHRNAAALQPSRLNAAESFCRNFFATLTAPMPHEASSEDKLHRTFDICWCSEPALLAPSTNSKTIICRTAVAAVPLLSRWTLLENDRYLTNGSKGDNSSVLRLTRLVACSSHLTRCIHWDRTGKRHWTEL